MLLKLSENWLMIYSNVIKLFPKQEKVPIGLKDFLP